MNPIFLSEFPPLVRPVPLESRFRHAFHAYHNESPWNPSMSHLLYTATDDPAQPGAVVAREAGSGKETILAETRCYNFHVGAWNLWALGGNAVVFMDERSGKQGPCLVHLETPGKTEFLEAASGQCIRCLSADGFSLYAFSDSDAKRDLRKTVISRTDLRSGRHEALVDAEELREAEPRLFENENLIPVLNHPVPNSEETRMFFKLVFRGANGKQAFDSFWVKNLETGVLHCHGNRISGHPIWMPDGKTILNIKHPQDGSNNRWIVEVDADTGADRRFLDLPIEGPGHLTIAPGGDHVASDAFTADGSASPVYLINSKTRTVREIIRLRHKFDGTGPANGKRLGDVSILRGQPHPAFSPDGRMIAVNWNDGGDRMRMVLMENLPL